VPPFRAAQIVGARFAFFVSLAHVKDRLKQGDGVFENGLESRRKPGDLQRVGAGITGATLWGLSLPAVGLRGDLHGSVKQIHRVKLKGSDKERPGAFPRIMFKQTDSGIQQLHGAGERTQKQQRGRRLLVDGP
jgi:hypothetical protein